MLLILFICHKQTGELSHARAEK